MVGRFCHRFMRVFILAAGVAGLLLLISQPMLGAQSQADETGSDLLPPQALSAPVWDGTYRRIRVPILMYHYISAPPEDADATRTDLSVTPQQFRAHVEYLFYQGYSTISLYDLHDALMTGAALPAKPVVLTFDDGYLDHYTEAYPILREFGFNGTFFIITGTADAQNPNHLSWEQISEMAANGMYMESHTKDHPDLRGRDYDFLVYQLLGSFESLRAYTGREPRMFCYPVGFYDSSVLSVLESLGVWRAVTTQGGAVHTTDNRLELTRLRIHNRTSVQGLASLLESS